jgi:hypothetical protein
MCQLQPPVTVAIKTSPRLLAQPSVIQASPLAHALVVTTAQRPKGSLLPMCQRQCHVILVTLVQTHLDRLRSLIIHC